MKNHEKICWIKSKNGYLNLKLKFENYKHWLEASQLENERNHLEQNKIDIDCIKINHKEFTKNQ